MELRRRDSLLLVIWRGCGDLGYPVGGTYPFGQGRGLPLIGSMPNRLFCPEDLGGSGELTLVLVDQHAQVLDPELSEG